MTHFADGIFSLPLIGLYAETHFRFFPAFPSLLFQRQPEVIFDMPRRLEPDQDLPISLIVNDIDRFPADLVDCAIVISQPGAAPKRFDFPQIADFEVSHPLRNCMRAFILRIARSQLPAGPVFVNARISVVCGKKRSVVFNDNLRGTGKLPYCCYIAESSLPGSDFCRYGDLHTHSQYSQSHVEFGPPISVIDAVAEASGLTCVAITDHSYDLACSPQNYLKSDPAISRWRLFQEEMAEPRRFRSILIPGEEVSCLNEKGDVVHLCGLNLREYLPGTLDGARKDRSKDRQLTLPEALAAIHGQGGIAFAAHPAARVGFLSRLFLRRGGWSPNDLATNIDGLQILNSGFSPSWSRGKAMWISMLQSGRKVPLFGGNDAHGDFNRYRAITVPFHSIGEFANRYMGYGKTGIYGRGQSVAELISGIEDGATFVTTGPFAAICTSPSPADTAISRHPISSETALFVHAQSTPEFGKVTKVTVYAGSQGKSVESVAFSCTCVDEKYQLCEKIDLAAIGEKPMYLRAEVCCSGAQGNAESRAFTSAVYFG